MKKRSLIILAAGCLSLSSCSEEQLLTIWGEPQPSHVWVNTGYSDNLRAEKGIPNRPASPVSCVPNLAVEAHEQPVSDKNPKLVELLYDKAGLMISKEGGRILRALTHAGISTIEGTDNI